PYTTLFRSSVAYCVSGGQAFHAFGSVNWTGDDGVDADTLPAPLQRQRACNHVYAGFGSTDVRLCGHGTDRLGRRDVDDGRTGFLQTGIYRLHDMEGTEQINLHY